METMICAVFLFTCLLGTSLQADDSKGLSESLCAGGPGLWPAPADCSGYVLCVGGPAPGNATVRRLLRCPPTTAFSAQLRTCVPASQVVGCGEYADEKNIDLTHTHMLSRQRRAGGAELAETEDGCDDEAVGPTCADCDRLVVCGQLNGHFTPIASVSCSAYGEDYSCSTQTKACELGSTHCKDAPQPLKFRCLEPGIFPDPVDCKRYHLCGPDLGHISATCDERYDPESKSCIDNPKEQTPSQCGEAVDCTRLGAVYTMAHAPAYYAICLTAPTPTKDGTAPKPTNQISVLGCPEGQIFDDTTKKCRLSCGSRRGRLPVDGDCRAYIECSSERAQPHRMTCGRGLAFDAGRRMCLPESQVASCSLQ